MDSGAHQYPSVLKRLLPLLLLYATLVAVILFVTATAEVERIRDEFVRDAKELFREADLKAKTFEICLEGFAQHLQTHPSLDYDKARRFANTILEHYPELYMLELAEYVPAFERQSFERKMRRRTGAEFAIHRFDYASSRTVLPITDRDSYYPITFIAPHLPGVTDVLGLDLTSTSPVHQQGLYRAIRSGKQDASELFHFLEGELGYLLYRPFDVGGKGASSPTPFIAIAAIRLIDLITPSIREQADWTITITHPASDGGIEIDNLLHPHQPERLSASLLPALTLHHRLSSSSQPLSMKVQYMPPWSVLNIRLISTVLLCILLLTGIFIYLMRRSVIQMRSELGFIQEVIGQAHYDTLTGLPNINLLMDRVERSLIQCQREHKQAAICYVDFDNFKTINDTFGHDTGDELLIQASQRLLRALRSGDTVSRIHGDEFVVLLPSVCSSAGADYTISKLKAAFETPFNLSVGPVSVSLSAGAALYPDDGDNAESLFAIADRRMYLDKANQRG
ncbi:GGDEF domain-containing protein [Motiliproteus sediminis]|uniref:GGDEF domain-containing protein n=1 Tax=Motiliproteus sediminis TaxID=1468178 RepID=UPI001AEFF1B0|nr:sensor domain-containing diguanylate cyclase [Motiliproteus sediminis]